MSPSLRDFIEHILNECSFILHIKVGKTRSELLDDDITGRAVVRSLEIIGEATKKLPEDFRLQHKHVPWSEIAGMRDVLIHNYFGVDYDVVWNTINNDIPFLHQSLLSIIDSETI
jgi:uncharacterized protein with HEPN domain